MQPKLQITYLVDQSLKDLGLLLTEKNVRYVMERALGYKVPDEQITGIYYSIFNRRRYANVPLNAKS